MSMQKYDPRDSVTCPGEWPNLSERNDNMDYIPNTKLTEHLRATWEILQDLGGEQQPFEEYYRDQSLGGSGNGRALAALLFYRARQYWPEYFAPADLPAVAAWAGMIDYYPLITPDIIEQAVDKVHAAGVTEPQPANFLRMARAMTGEAL